MTGKSTVLSVRDKNAVFKNLDHGNGFLYSWSSDQCTFFFREKNVAMVYCIVFATSRSAMYDICAPRRHRSACASAVRSVDGQVSNVTSSGQREYSDENAWTPHHNDSDVETTLLYCSNYMDVAVHFVMRESQIRFFLQCFQAGIITDNLWHLTGFDTVTKLVVVVVVL